jgi:hypothetical protein
VEAAKGLVKKFGFDHFYRLTRSNAGGAFFTPAAPGRRCRKHP